MRLTSILYIVTIVLIAASIVLPLGDPDMWWHLVVGQWIIAHGTVPDRDYWNLFSAGSPWLAYSWSNEVLYAFCDQLFGTYGLLLLSFGLALALAGGLVFLLSDAARDRVVGLALGALATTACYAHFGLRPQTFSWILFGCLLHALLRLEEHGIRKGLLLRVAVICLIWANTHLTVAVGMTAAIFWFFDAARLKQSTIFLAQILGVCFVGSLVTPYLGKEWLTFFGKADHPFSHLYIHEFQPATLHHAAANITLLLFILLLALLHQRPKSVRPAQFIAALGLLVVAFSVQKFIPFSAIYTAFLIAAIWRREQNHVRAFGNLGEAMVIAKSKLYRLPVWFSLPTILVFSGLIFGNLRAVLLHPLDTSSIPVSAFNFFEQKGLQHPLLSGFNEGGYVLYRLQGSDGTTAHRVPLDGRTNVNDHDTVRAFLSANFAENNWRDYFNKVAPETVLWNNSSPLNAVLLENSEWCHVYPEASKEIGSSNWSIYIKREELLKRSGEFDSRDCKPEPIGEAANKEAPQERPVASAEVTPVHTQPAQAPARTTTQRTVAHGKSRKKH